MSTEQAPAESPVILYDTTLRDGTQGENITLSLADKIRIARMLDEYGMPLDSIQTLGEHYDLGRAAPWAR